MKLFTLALLATSVLHAVPLKLGPGEYRWLPFTVKKVPTAVDCRFQVMQGGATVRMEIMTAASFRRFSHGREYDLYASSPDGRAGQIKRIIDQPGEFAVVIENDDKAPPALVDLELNTDVNPSPDSLARVLPPGRRLSVILISFGIFFALVTWSGWKLWKSASHQ